MPRQWIGALSLSLAASGAVAASGQDDHHHGQVAVSDPATAPAVTLRVEQDAVSGWNLQLETENFRFAPDKVNTEHVAGEGHGHLYLNDERVSRVYGHWLHLPELPAGEHELRVTLNANDHSAYHVAGEPVADSVTVRAPE